MKQLSGQDNSFLEIEGIGIPQHISSVAIYDQSTAPGGAVRFKEILSHLESRLHLSPIFRNKLQRVPMGLDRPYLVDDPDFYKQCIEETYAELKSAALPTRGKPRAKTKAKTKAKAKTRAKAPRARKPKAA
jgi:hypothetical protein